MRFAESDVEEAAIQWLQGLGYNYVPGPEIAPDSLFPERAKFSSVILEGRLRKALARKDFCAHWIDPFALQRRRNLLRLSVNRLHSRSWLTLEDDIDQLVIAHAEHD